MGTPPGIWWWVSLKTLALDACDTRGPTQAFSKKPENRIYAFALHTMYHNFVKISGAHRMTTAVKAGVDKRL